MFDEEQLRELSHAERHRLMRALAAAERSDPENDQAGRRRRVIVLAMIVVCCVVLAAWIGVLAVTLPKYYRAGGWRGAWVGFDLALLTAFAVTGWAAWRRRQVLVICLVVLATLLCCDAWFDVVLDARTSGFDLSLLSAVFIELPLAALAALGARRLLHLSIAAVWRYEGEAGEAPSVGQATIIGGSPSSPLSDLFSERDARPGSGGSPEPASSSAAGASDYGDADYGYPNPGYESPGYESPGYPNPGYESAGPGNADAGLCAAPADADHPARAAEPAD